MTRKEILTEAGRIIRDEGYDRLTMSALAQALGVRKASLYYHFQSKEEIIQELYEHFENGLLHLSFSVDFSKSTDAVMSTALSHWKNIFSDRENSVFISLIEQRKETDERAWADAGSLYLMIESQSEAILENLSVSSRLKIMNVPLMSKMFASTVYLMLVNEDESIDQFVSSFIENFLE